jgi:hypothetical protein
MTIELMLQQRMTFGTNFATIISNNIREIGMEKHHSNKLH